jgi:hypothetical protein
MLGGGASNVSTCDRRWKIGRKTERCMKKDEEKAIQVSMACLYICLYECACIVWAKDRM